MKGNYQEKFNKGMRSHTRSMRTSERISDTSYRRINCVREPSKARTKGRNWVREHGREIISRSSLTTCCLTSISLIDGERGDRQQPSPRGAQMCPLDQYCQLCDCMPFVRTQACILTLKARKAGFSFVLKSR